MIETTSIWILIGITGMAVIFHEVLLKNQVSPKGNRLFFYFLLILHVLVFLRFTLPEKVNFAGNLTVFNLSNYSESFPTPQIMTYELTDYILAVYLLGIGVGIIKLMLGVFRIIRLTSRSVPGRNRFERRVDTNNFHPFTFFRYLFIPAKLPKDVYNSVYHHEKYHAEQWHTLDMLLWHLMSIIFWFNPFVHILKSRQTQNLEYDTDEQLIKIIPREEYSKHLLSAVFVTHSFDFNPMFNKSKIYLRMKRLNQKRTRKGFKSYVTLICTLSLLLGGLVLSKASFSTKTHGHNIIQMSKPEFPPHGHGHYIDSVLQVKIGDKFDNIAKDFDLHLFLDITIDENGKVASVKENSPKTSRSGDESTNNYLSGLLIETIENMPKWVPAKENGVSVTSTIQEEFHFSGGSE